MAGLKPMKLQVQFLDMWWPLVPLAKATSILLSANW